MQRCAVVIGVDKTGGWPELSAASSGARQFDQWAQSQGVTTTLLIDDAGRVTVDELKREVKALLDAGRYEQLIVFFAGHGMLKAPDTELWMLSGAPEDPDEAVNLPLSINHARNSPLRHVVFISDACRSLPVSMQQFGVIGRSIFPNLRPPQRRPRVDLLFAAAPGDPAYEAPVDEAVDSYRGIYTTVLLDGLKARDARIAETHDGKVYVFTRGIDPYLAREVPRAAAEVNLTLRQVPETRPESSPPLYLAELSPDVRVPASRSSNSPTLSLPSLPAMSFSLQMEASDAGDDRQQEDMNQVLAARGRQSFETAVGFTVVGAEVLGAYVLDQSGAHVFEEAGRFHVRLYASAPTSVLLVLGDRTSTILAVWPRMIGTVLVKKGGVANVTYVPSDGTPEFDEYQKVEERVERRRALVASKALHGRFRLDPEKAADDARYLRQLKRMDPTLGLYAAYAYAQAGAGEEIESVLSYMKEDLGVPPFDVALLAGRLPGGPFTGGAVVPCSPLLTQGWLHLDEAWERLPSSLREAGRHLRTALWTTFQPDFAHHLERFFEQGGSP